MADDSIRRELEAAFRQQANDMTGQYNTLLAPAEEADFLKAYPDSRDWRDYDMRGAFKQGIQPGENGHFPDTFKKPNHPTFSNESVYHGKDGNFGGSWMQQGEGWQFTPGPTNLKLHGIDGLNSYLQQSDPTVTLVQPPVEAMGAR